MTNERRLCPWCWPDPPNELIGNEETCGARCRQRKSRWLRNHPDGIMPWEVDEGVTGVTNPGHSVTAGNEVLLAMQDNNELLRELLEVVKDNRELLQQLVDNCIVDERPHFQSVLPARQDEDTAEIEIEIKQAAPDTENNAAFNFMIQTASSVYGSYKGLSAEVLEYGVRTGRITQ